MLIHYDGFGSMIMRMYVYTCYQIKLHSLIHLPTDSSHYQNDWTVSNYSTAAAAARSSQYMSQKRDTVHVCLLERPGLLELAPLLHDHPPALRGEPITRVHLRGEERRDDGLSAECIGERSLAQHLQSEPTGASPSSHSRFEEFVKAEQAERRSTHRRARLHEKNERIEVGFEVMSFGVMSFGVMGVAVMGVVAIGVAVKGVVHLKI